MLPAASRQPLGSLWVACFPFPSGLSALNVSLARLASSSRGCPVLASWLPCCNASLGLCGSALRWLVGCLVGCLTWPTMPGLIGSLLFGCMLSKPQRVTSLLHDSGSRRHQPGAAGSCGSVSCGETRCNNVLSLCAVLGAIYQTRGPEWAENHLPEGKVCTGFSCMSV